MFDQADVISRYTRAQAIEDGVLVDLSQHADARRCYKFPVAFTAALWAKIARGAGKDASTRNVRIWDVCFMATLYARRQQGDRARFRVKVGPQVLNLVAHCGPGDTAEPVITIGFPEDF